MLQPNKFTIISPCHNEEKNIENLLKNLNDLREKNNFNFDVLLIDDGSTDKTWEKIKNEKKKYSFLKGIKLSKNFGKESAIDAGLNSVVDDNIFLIIIDADLQHPIDKIPDLIKKYNEEDLDIVNTHRTDLNEGFVREIFSKLFYKILDNFSEIKIISKTTDFMLISQKVRNEYIKIEEIDKTFRILINWLGFKKKSIPISINFRKFGKTKYQFFNLFRLATNTISSFSIFPIKIIGYFGLFMSVIAFATLVFFILNYFFKLTVFSWQTQFIVLQIFLSGLIMTSVGLVGIYVLKILNNTNSRPNYIVEEKF